MAEVNLYNKMVNKHGSTRSLLLDRLRRSGRSVRGTAICDELGVSRVAVWKQVEALKDRGYRIVSDHSGYRLAGDRDSIQAWEFPDYEDLVVHYDRTDSTMDRALALASGGDGRDWIVVAESQEKGRGRNGKSWKSERGGLFCTLVLHPRLGLDGYMKPLLGAGIALCRAIRELTGREAALEWPNDLYLGSRKIAGLLPEFLGSGEGFRFYDLGLGVNVDNKVSEASQANLASLPGKRITRRDVLTLFMERLEPFRKSDFSQADLAAIWWSLSSSGGRTAAGKDGKRLGRACGLAPDGCLIVETRNGGAKAFGIGAATLVDKEKMK